MAGNLGKTDTSNRFESVTKNTKQKRNISGHYDMLLEISFISYKTFKIYRLKVIGAAYKFGQL